MYGNVQQSLKNNLNEFINNPEKLEKDLTEWINNGDIVYRFFRWFSSGDIVNKKFFEMMVNIAETFLTIYTLFSVVGENRLKSIIRIISRLHM